ncbi:hypothetical protein L484_024630 [Morus notabilis]|uniref:Uncharacterized protein n=1 Tax=Morus notabilis TaxID=981085 RepID=W9QS02_9ROSA|nr:hypothetical protein L484_024630 [Morus notabilis]
MGGRERLAGVLLDPWWWLWRIGVCRSGDGGGGCWVYLVGRRRDGRCDLPLSDRLWDGGSYLVGLETDGVIFHGQAFKRGILREFGNLRNVCKLFEFYLRASHGSLSSDGGVEKKLIRKEKDGWKIDYSGEKPAMPLLDSVNYAVHMTNLCTQGLEQLAAELRADIVRTHSIEDRWASQFQLRSWVNLFFFFFFPFKMCTT